MDVLRIGEAMRTHRPHRTSRYVVHTVKEGKWESYSINGLDAALGLGRLLGQSWVISSTGVLVRIFHNKEES